MMALVSLGQIVTGLFALDTLRRTAPGMDDMGGWFALLFGVAALSLAVSAGCLFVGWRRYGWVRYGSLQGARLGLVLFMTPLIVIALPVLVFAMLPTLGEP